MATKKEVPEILLGSSQDESTYGQRVSAVSPLCNNVVQARSTAFEEAQERKLATQFILSLLCSATFSNASLRKRLAHAQSFTITSII